MPPGTLKALASCAAACCCVFTTAAQDVQVITEQVSVSGVQLVEVTDSIVRVRTPSGEYRQFPINETIAIIGQPSEGEHPRREGMLVLADGQRFPGRPLRVRRSGSTTFSWLHDTLGELSAAVDDIAWLNLREVGAEPPLADDADLVILSNGDRISGFVSAIGDSIEVEAGENAMEIELDRVAQVRLLNPPKPPAPGSVRIWLHNGTVVDVPSLHFADDGILRFAAPPVAAESSDQLFHFTLVAAILFAHDQLTPLASISPHDVTGPPTRYIIPAPEASNESAPLGLRSIGFRGPLVARYSLPPKAMRFSATVVLAPGAETWGHCDVVVYSDSEEVHRSTLSADTSVAEIDVSISGSELTIEIAEGLHGPIQDHIILERAMIVGSKER